MINTLIKWISPQWAANRWAAQKQWEMARTAYDAADQRRQSGPHIPFGTAGDVQGNERVKLRNKAQDLSRNNATCQSLVNAIVGRVATDRLVPEPLCDERHRDTCRKIWDVWSNECHTLGFAGKGGLTINQLWQQCYRETVIAGECLPFYRFHSFDQMRKLNLTYPITVELLESERLDELKTTYGNVSSKIYEGVQLNELGRREGYWIRQSNPYHPMSAGLFNSQFVPAEFIQHVYLPQRPSQIRGYTWLASAIEPLYQIGDLSFNELVSSTIAACFAVWLEVAPSSRMNFGTPPQGESSSDEYEYRKLFTKPGMVPKLKPGEKVNAFDPGRPNASTDQFSDHLLRKMSTPFPIKGSQLTGDYRASSFSSEMSNENDNTPLVNAMHNWFVTTCCQPMYEQVMLTAHLMGEFGDVDVWESGITKCGFPQPEVRSINPVNDVRASMMRAMSGLGSIKKEAAKWGNDLDANLADLAYYLDKSEQLGIPREVFYKLLEVETTPVEVNEKTESQA